MPELPEVETMVGRLQKHVGQRVVAVAPTVGNDPTRYNACALSPPQELQGIFRRGKFMVFMLEDRALLAHNAMSGYWDEDDVPWTFNYVEGQRKAGDTDVRAMIGLKDAEGKEHTLRFHDARKFGSLRVLVPTELAEKLSGLGPEADHTTWMYEPAEVMTLEKFINTLQGSKKPVKELLMDQGRIAGVGNIYASEACWHARVSPLRPADGLREDEQIDLFASVRSVLRQALERRLDYGGLKVYRRKQCQRCIACPTANQDGARLRAEKLKGRTTYWCPSCQK